MRTAHISALLLAVALLPTLSAAQDTFTVSNELGLSWPMDLTYRDYPAGKLADGPYVAKMGSVTRPVQVQRIRTRDQRLDRAWFVATLTKETAGEKDRRGHDALKDIEISIEKGSADSPLTLTEKGKWLTVDNGVYEFRVRNFSGKISEPVPLKDFPHWIGGMRVKGTDAWDGRAWFDGETKVCSAKTTIVQRGPAFIDLRIEYLFATEDRVGIPACKARPMTLGKQTHKYPPNTLPTVNAPKSRNDLSVLVRFIANDPFIEVNEMYHFERPGNQFIHWGEPGKLVPDGYDAIPASEHMPVDTAMWVRWFEYDRFGGNTSLRIVPAEPRDAQKGRPFANVQPRWTQRGAGSQDFFLTSGGPGPGKNRKAGAGYAPTNPCVGIYATFASKWVNPYGQMISAYAEDRKRGYVRLPMRNGTADLHFGQRSYALVVGERKRFDNTGRANNMVRRHTDWTLPAQMNKYVLSWKRDPSKAGPHILLTRKKLNKLREAYRADKDTPAVRVMKAALDDLAKVEALHEQLSKQLDAAKAILKSKDASDAEKKQAGETVDQLKRQLKQTSRRMGSEDVKILKLITAGEGRGRGLPGAGLWIGRRYQDDFLNPTSSPTRRIKGVGEADLYSGGKPQGGASFAAMGYIHSDLDQWPGWHNGWNPGNPNFHTDKYMVAVYVAAAMLDHPHAKEWLDFGYANFREDLGKVLLAPDGVGWECPGYSGYSFGLQMKIAKIFLNVGYGNPVAEDPLARKTGTWHRKLLTPVDPRLGFRHEAPHGDTHRWTSGMKSGFGKLAAFYAEKDPAFAREMAGTWAMLRAMGYSGGGVRESLIDMDPSVTPLDPRKMDWSSEAFYGFGAIMRSGFGTDRETFCSVKAGPARGHYHNDELAFHYYAGNTPISLDYNCSYHPRADHACLHNSMTFGKEGKVQHNARNTQVPAHEQIYGTARVGAFRSTKVADALVAERTSGRLVMQPIDPKDHEFARGYPSRQVEPITHRRFLVMVKHSEDSKLADYLVVREETNSTVPQQLNVHLLARDAKIKDGRVTLSGQWDQDMLVAIADAESPKIEKRSYWYRGGHHGGPLKYAIRPGESMGKWRSRLHAMMEDQGAKHLPLDDDPGHGDEKEWANRVAETDGKALMPPYFWKGKWTPGEYQVWLRVETKAGAPITWVLYPYERGQDAPKVERIAGGKGVRVTLGEESEDIYLATSPAEGQNGQVTVRRDGQTHIVLPPFSVGKLLGIIPQAPLRHLTAED